jgi:hypothetical protein
MNLDLPGFGTLCSHLIAVPRHAGCGQSSQFLFAAGPPDQARFELVPL